jgi:hypothetical protein
MQLTHPVSVLFGQRAQFALEADFDIKIQISVVACIGLHGEHPENLFVPFDRQIIIQVKHGLLPVSVRRVWRRAESHALVAFREFNSEKCHQSVNIIVATKLKKNIGK